MEEPIQLKRKYHQIYAEYEIKFNQKVLPQHIYAQIINVIVPLAKITPEYRKIKIYTLSGTEVKFGWKYDDDLSNVLWIQVSDPDISVVEDIFDKIKEQIKTYVKVNSACD